MKTEEDYQKEWKALALRFGFGRRVCRHIVNTYKDQYDIEAFILKEVSRARAETIKEVEKIIEPFSAKRIADINERYMGSRECKMCGQNPEEWCKKLLSQLKVKE